MNLLAGAKENDASENLRTGPDGFGVSGEN
jgi:hypothetical protein